MVFVQTQAEAFYKSGLDSYAANDYSNAVEQWRKAQDLFPHYKNTDVMIVEANRKAAGEQERRQSLSRKKEDQIRKSKALAREAALLVEKKSYKEAIARMDLAADLDPDNPEIQKKRQDIRDQFNSLVEQLYEDGVASYNQEKLSIAIIKWNEVLKLAPDHQLALNFLAKANEQKQKSIELHLASGQQYFQNKEYAKALSEFREAGALAPENKDIRTKETLARERLKNDIERSFKEGQDSYSKGELEKAVEAFNQALTLDPEYIAASDYIKKCRTQLNQKEQEISIQTHLEKGKEYLKNRFFNNAIEEFNAVLAISAGHKDAQRLKMETEKMISENDSKSQVSKMFLEAAKHFRNEEYGEALDVLNKMKVLDPGNALVERYIMVVSSRWNTRCEKYYKKAVKSEEDGNFPEARDYYGKTMKLNTNYLDVKEKVKTFDVRAKDFLAATEKKALSFYADGNYIESYLLWSQILKISPDNKRALEYSRNASARSAEYKEAEKLKNSGISNFKNNHPEEALSDLVQAIELNKGLSESIKAATEELRKQLLPKSQNLFENADTSYNKGEYPAALHSISAFLYLIPNNQSALDLRQNIKKGMEKAAGEHYAKAQAALNRKDYSGGLKELEIVIQLSPNNQDARNLYNKIDNEYAGLRTDQERKKKVNIDTLLFEGIRFYREGDLKKAIGKWQEVLAVDSGNAKALDYINRARTKLNKIGS